MADGHHAVTQLDFLIRQMTFFPDEIGYTVGQKLNILCFKTSSWDFGKQVAAVFLLHLLKFLQKVMIVVCYCFACQRIQHLGKILLGESMRIRQAFSQGLFHVIGKLPVRRMNLSASSLAYIKEIVKCKPCVPIHANGNALCAVNQISAYASPLLFCRQD